MREYDSSRLTLFSIIKSFSSSTLDGTKLLAWLNISTRLGQSKKTNQTNRFFVPFSRSVRYACIKYFKRKVYWCKYDLYLPHSWWGCRHYFQVSILKSASLTRNMRRKVSRRKRPSLSNQKVTVKLSNVDIESDKVGILLSRSVFPKMVYHAFMLLASGEVQSREHSFDINNWKLKVKYK